MKLTQKIMSDTPLVPAVYGRILVRLLEEQCISIQQSLSETGIKTGTLFNPDGYLSVNQLLRLFLRARILSRCPAIAIRYGLQLGMSAHGILACAIINQGSSHDVLQAASGYIAFRMPLAKSEFITSDNSLVVNIKEVWPSPSLHEFIVEVFLASLRRMANDFSHPCVMHFRHRLHCHLSLYQNLLDCELHSGADNNQLIIETRRPGNTPSMFSINCEQAVVSALKHEVITNPGRRCTIDRIADQLETTTRTLSRHLNASGLSFSDLKNTVRLQFATRYLHQASLTIAEIADRLGYSDQASFTKAFRNWTGRTPGTFRREVLQEQKGGARPPSENQSATRITPQ